MELDNSKVGLCIFLWCDSYLCIWESDINSINEKDVIIWTDGKKLFLAPVNKLKRSLKKEPDISRILYDIKTTVFSEIFLNMCPTISIKLKDYNVVGILEININFPHQNHYLFLAKVLKNFREETIIEENNLFKMKINYIVDN